MREFSPANGFFFTVAAPMLGANTANILLRQGYVGQVAMATTNLITKTDAL